MNDPSPAKPRFIFMGTPDFAAAALRALVAAGHIPVAVYSQPPRPKGRGRQVQPSPVHMLAQQNGIPVYHPETLKSQAAQAEFAALKPDIAIVAAYGLILPQAVLSAPRYGCVNIHASLLPRWRGASPIQRAIWAGDAQSGITLMQMDAGLDTGPMLRKAALDIGPGMTAAALHDELADLGGRMIVSFMEELTASGAMPPGTAQDEAQTNYARLLTREDGRVDFSQSAQQIERQVRALTPWPGVWCAMPGGGRLKILSAEILPGVQQKSGAKGEIMDRSGLVCCGGGAAFLLRLTRVQPEGASKPMDFAAAVNGGYLSPGMVLS